MRKLGLTALVAGAAMAATMVAAPAHAQDLCGNDVNDPCSLVSSWTSSYSAADLMRIQYEIQAQQLSATVLSSIVDSYSSQYRAIVTYIR